MSNWQDASVLFKSSSLPVCIGPTGLCARHAGLPDWAIQPGDLQKCLAEVREGTSRANLEMRKRLEAMEKQAESAGWLQLERRIKQCSTVVETIMRVEDSVLLPAVTKWGICPLYRAKLKVSCLTRTAPNIASVKIDMRLEKSKALRQNACSRYCRA